MNLMSRDRGGLLLACVAGVLLLLSSGCQSPGGSGSPAPAPAPTGAASTNALTQDTLQVGNRITIAFSGLPNAPEAHVEQIRNDGYVTPPLLGKPVLAAGKSIAELQKELRDLYVPAFFRDVTITVRNEERYYFVDGQVRMPGQKPYLTEMTVLRAIQTAGGFTEYANRGKVQVTRADKRQDTVDCKKALRNPRYDLPIYPGDSIYVPQKPI